MYKKKLRRLGVACMTVAMVLTTVSFPSVAKAEEGTSTQADGVTSSELEKGKVLVQVDQNVLKANAISNSNEFPHRNGDGSASWAFDNENHWWHSRYTFPESAESPNYFKGETLRNKAAIASENPWIGSGFGREITLYKITYTSNFFNKWYVNFPTIVRHFSRDSLFSSTFRVLLFLFFTEYGEICPACLLFLWWFFSSSTKYGMISPRNILSLFPDIKIFSSTATTVSDSGYSPAVRFFRRDHYGASVSTAHRLPPVERAGGTGPGRTAPPS